MSERVTGIEPVSPPWQGDIIATIPYPPTSQALLEISAGRPALVRRARRNPILHFNILIFNVPRERLVPQTSSIAGLLTNVRKTLLMLYIVLMF